MTVSFFETTFPGVFLFQDNFALFVIVCPDTTTTPTEW
jgi:hypothetical protein